MIQYIVGITGSRTKIEEDSQIILIHVTWPLSAILLSTSNPAFMALKDLFRSLTSVLYDAEYAESTTKLASIAGC